MKKTKKSIKIVTVIFSVVLILISALLIMDSNYGKTEIYSNIENDPFISIRSSSLCPWNTYVITTEDGSILATGHSYLTARNAVANPLEIHSFGKPIKVTLSWAGTYELKPGDSELLRWALSPNVLFVTVVWMKEKESIVDSFFIFTKTYLKLKTNKIKNVVIIDKKKKII